MAVAAMIACFAALALTPPAQLYDPNHKPAPVQKPITKLSGENTAQQADQAFEYTVSTDHPFTDKLSSGASELASTIKSPVESLFEYQKVLNASEIFPNPAVKQRVVNLQNETEYHLPRLTYNILGQHIEAANVTVDIKPTKLDSTSTRLDLYLSAPHATVNGGAQGMISKSYDDLELKSVYGIYDSSTDKVTVHAPYSVIWYLVK
ncbi:MAG: hypothetical protein ABI361_05270 [Nitrososphaera sp.]